MAKRRRRQEWSAGDIFVIYAKDKERRLDGSSFIGQIIAHEEHALSAVICAFFDQRASDLEEVLGRGPDISRMFSVLFLTRSAVDYEWEIAGHAAIAKLPSKKEVEIDALRSREYIGMSMKTAPIIEDFLAAYRGVSPWDPYPQFDYFDGLLLDPSLKPKKLLYKKDIES